MGQILLKIQIYDLKNKYFLTPHASRKERDRKKKREKKGINPMSNVIIREDGNIKRCKVVVAFEM